MKKIHLKKINRTTKLKKGSYSVSVISLVIAVAIVFNLFVRQLPSKFINIDLSTQKLYSVSAASKNIVKNLKDDVTIYQVAEIGSENSYLKKLLDSYSSLSSHINVETLDSQISPGLLTKYNASDLEDNSLIVVCNDRYKTISYEDIFETDYSNYYYDGSTSTNYDGEGEITSAINYVTTTDLPVMYTLTGHSEQDFGDSISKSIEKQNVTIKDINLLSSDIPDDCSILAIVSPAVDCSEEEATKIIKYLENGGNALIFMQYSEKDMTNFDSILEAYGVAMQTGYLYEGDSSYCFSNGYYLLPEVKSHEITNSIINDGLYILVPFVQGINVLDDARSTLTITNLLETTTSSYADVDYGADGSMVKSSKDVNGPFSIATAIEENVDDNNTTKLVVFGSANIISENVTEQYTVGNVDMLTNSINWMTGNSSNVSIAAKSLSTTYNTVAASTANFYTSIFCVIIPGAIIIAGLAIWIRRRKA